MPKPPKSTTSSSGALGTVEALQAAMDAEMAALDKLKSILESQAAAAASPSTGPESTT